MTRADLQAHDVVQAVLLLVVAQAPVAVEGHGHQPAQSVPVAGAVVTTTGGTSGGVTDAWHLQDTGHAIDQPVTPGADVAALDGWQAGTGTGTQRVEHRQRPPGPP